MDVKAAVTFAGVFLGICAIMLFGFLYITRPAPELTLDDVLVQRTQEKGQMYVARTEAEQREEFKKKCGAGVSGALCRLGQGTCGTSLGSYFCLLEGKGKDLEHN